MTASIVRPTELGEGELLRWAQLQETHPELGNPFLSSSFAVAVSRRFPRTRVAVFECDGFQGFLPFEMRFPRFGSSLALGLSDAQAAIVSPEAPVTFGAMLDSCGLELLLFDHLVGHQFARLTDSPGRRNAHASPTLDLSAGYTAYVAAQRQVSKTVFSFTNRRRRQLEREVGPLQFTSHSTDHALLDKVLRWKSMQYQQTGRPDLFAAPRVYGLIHDLLDTHDALGGGGAFSVLTAGDHVVAGHFGLRSSSILSYWFPAYDPMFGQYSPGMILLLEMASECAEHGIHRFDLGKGGEPYKQRLASTNSSVCSGYVSRGAWSSAAYSFFAVPRDMVVNFILESPKRRRVARAGLRHLRSVTKSAYHRE